MPKTMPKKVVLKCLLDEYEKYLYNDKKKTKEDYIGHVGEVIHKTRSIYGHEGPEILYDIRFKDGQIWCCERKQLGFINE